MSTMFIELDKRTDEINGDCERVYVNVFHILSFEYYGKEEVDGSYIKMYNGDAFAVRQDPVALKALINEL